MSGVLNMEVVAMSRKRYPTYSIRDTRTGEYLKTSCGCRRRAWSTKRAAVEALVLMVLDKEVAAIMESSDAIADC